MNIYKTIIRFSLFNVLLLAVIMSGCEKGAPLTIDPIEKDTLFTFTPKHGYPGTTVKLEGSVVSGVNQVAFGSTEAEIGTSSEGVLNVVVPVGATSGKIKLIKETGVVTSLDIFTVDDTPIPTILEFSPEIVGSSQTVTLAGSLLDIVDSVYIGELKAEVISQSATSIELTTPEGLQTGYINLYYTYMTDYGIEQIAIAKSDIMLTLELPVIISVEPDISALDIGDVLTVIGTMFNSLDTIYFGDVGAVNYTITSDTELEVEVPVGAVSGKIIFVVADGQTETQNDFQINLPTIESFLPIKGDDISPINRTISIIGTNFSLVNSVQLGGVDGTIIAKTETHMTFEVNGAAGGFLKLVTDNGDVISEEPFILYGDFWVNDWDTDFEVSRFSHFQNNGIGNLVEAVVDDGTGNNYGEFTMSGLLNNKSIYMWGADNGTYDRFSLFTSNPSGVYLEFDMKVSSIDEENKQTDGTFKFKIFMMDARGWGASGEYSYGSNGPTSYVRTDGEWQHFRMELATFVASNNSGLYTADQVTASGDLRPEAFCHPNSLRIATFVFGIPNASEEGNVVLGLDNVKFAIEE